MNPSESKKQYLYSIDFARCLALILLIAGHCSYYFEYRHGELFHHQSIRTFLVGNSILFVFLSGFLFEYLLHKGFHYKYFIKNKFLTILLPYLILTTPLAVTKIYAFLSQPDFCEPNIQFDCFLGVVGKASSIYLYGQAAIGHWFMPFIFLVFALTPAFLLFLGLSKSRQLILILVLSIVAIFVHRPVGASGQIQNLLYFSGVFLLGIFTSNNYNKLQDFKLSIVCVSGLFTLGFLCLQFYLGEPSGFKNNGLLEFNGIDWLYLQKIFLCFFLLFFSHLIFNRYSRYTQAFARMSFGMVLIHPYVMIAVNKLVGRFLQVTKPYPAGVEFLGYVTIVCIGSAIFAVLCKRILGNRSRYLTGY